MPCLDVAEVDLERAFAAGGARRLGDWPATGYVHARSRAERTGSFVGIALDVERPTDHVECGCDAVLAEVRATKRRCSADPWHR